LSELRYWLWLSSAPVGCRAKAALAQFYGSAEAAFLAPPGEFATVNGVSEKEAAVLERRSLDAVSDIQDDCAANGVSIITMQDAQYPARLKHIFAPPVVLYVKGSLPIMDDEAAIAVVGTRSASPYGMKMARRIAAEISRCGGTVISGLTSGIDAAAADGALRVDGKCVAVLGTPIEGELGSLAHSVAAHGALVSEYCPGARVLKSNYRERNRISAGLAVGVAVIEAPAKSGALLFAAEAVEQGKEVFALPGNADALNSAGTIALLKDGAKPITCGWDIMSEFASLFPERIRRVTAVELPENEEKTVEDVHPNKKEVDKPQAVEYITVQELLSGLSADELAVASAIAPEGTHVDDIAEAAGFPSSKTLSVLTLLEIKRIAVRRSGMRYFLNTAKK